MRINEDNRKALPGDSKAQATATVRALLENSLFLLLPVSSPLFLCFCLLFFFYLLSALLCFPLLFICCSFFFLFFPAFSVLVMKNRGRCWLLLSNLGLGFCSVCGLCFLGFSSVFLGFSSLFLLAFSLFFFPSVMLFSPFFFSSLSFCSLPFVAFFFPFRLLGSPLF